MAARKPKVDVDAAPDMAAIDAAVKAFLDRLHVGPGVPPSINPTLAALMAAIESKVPLVVARTDVRGQDVVLLSAVAGHDADGVHMVPLAILLDHSGLNGALRPLSPQEVAERDAKVAAEDDRLARRGYL